MNQVWMLVWFDVRRFLGRRRWLVWVLPALTVLGTVGIVLSVRHIVQDYGSFEDAGVYIADLGHDVLFIVMMLALLATCVTTPALAAGAFAGEREKSTLELLLLTRLSSWQIVFARLLIASLPVPIGILAIVPAAVAAVLLHGARPLQTLLAFAVYLAACFAIAAISLCCSALSRRSVTASVVAYVATVFFVILPLLFYIDYADPVFGNDYGNPVQQSIPLVIIGGPLLWLAWVSLKRAKSASGLSGAKRAAIEAAGGALLLLLLFVGLITVSYHYNMTLQSPLETIAYVLGDYGMNGANTIAIRSHFMSSSAGIALDLLLGWLLMRFTVGYVEGLRRA